MQVEFQSEVHQGDGRSNMEVRFPEHVCVMEFKYGESPQAALDQIRSHDYGRRHFGGTHRVGRTGPQGVDKVASGRVGRLRDPRARPGPRAPVPALAGSRTIRDSAIFPETTVHKPSPTTGTAGAGFPLAGIPGREARRTRPTCAAKRTDCHRGPDLLVQPLHVLRRRQSVRRSGDAVMQVEFQSEVHQGPDGRSRRGHGGPLPEHVCVMGGPHGILDEIDPDQCWSLRRAHGPQARPGPDPVPRLRPPPLRRDPPGGRRTGPQLCAPHRGKNRFTYNTLTAFCINPVEKTPPVAVDEAVHPATHGGNP